jgi:hypothetical protein
MKTIYKYPLEITDLQSVSIPFGYTLLSVQMQSGKPCLWAMVDTDNIEEKCTIEMFGTGNPINPIKGIGQRVFIDTFQIHGAGLVFHVFEYKL